MANALDTYILWDKAGNLGSLMGSYLAAGSLPHMFLPYNSFKAPLA
jgi:hypothetical protein